MSEETLTEIKKLTLKETKELLDELSKTAMKLSKLVIADDK